MSKQPHIEILPTRSLGGRRWDIVCAGILLAPLVLLAFQGDILFGIAERINYDGRYTVIRDRERQLVKSEEAKDQLREELQALDLRVQVQRMRARELRALQVQIKTEIEDLEREIKARRQPLEEQTRFWNFSIVKRWQLLLLLGPLTLSLIWFGLPVVRRRALFEAGLAKGVRARGLLIGLGGIALFWLGAWQQAELGQAIVRNVGDYDFTPSLLQRTSWIVVYASLILWSVGALYSFGGRRALLRIGGPLAVVMVIMVLNYGPMSTWWTDRWDTSEAWGYGYFIGPIAAMLFFYKLSEVLRLPGEQHLSLGLSGRSPLWAAPSEPSPATVSWYQRSGWRVLALWAAAILALTAGLFVLTGYTGHQAAFEGVILYPILGGLFLALLAAWQGYEKDRRADVAMRLVGLAVVVASIAFRWKGAQMRVAYFQHVSMIGVLAGGVLAAFGYRVFRATWVALAFLYLAIPWPERTYVDMAQVPQEWAAIMTEKFMLLVGYTVTRDGNTLQVLPGPEGTLAVAEKCSGLKMLFAFVALSVVYAYISRRPAWRRVVIFASSFPIAILSNFARVIAMALATRWGYRQIAQDGLQHTLTGFVVMLPLAFLMLYLEMRLLDAIEWLADIIVGEEPPKDRAPGSTADVPTDGR